MRLYKYFILILLLLVQKNLYGEDSFDINIIDQFIAKGYPRSQLNMQIDNIKSKLVFSLRRYLGELPEPVIDEIINYRKDVAILNKEQRELFAKLSEKAKQYLNQERLYKAKLFKELNDSKNNKYENIVSSIKLEYRQYLYSLSQDVIEEIRLWRENVKVVNNKEKMRYRQLSQEAQKHLNRITDYHVNYQKIVKKQKRINS